MAIGPVQNAAAQAACTSAQLLSLAASALADAASDGRLHSAFAEIKRQQPKASHNQSERLNEARGRLRALLTRAADDGRLAAELRASAHPLAEPTPRACAATAALVDDREKLARALSDAAADGRLAAMIAEVKSGRCTKVAPAVSQPVERPLAGRGSASNASGASPDEVEAARAHARELLFQALENGRLATELGAIKRNVDASGSAAPGARTGEGRSIAGRAAQVDARQVSSIADSERRMSGVPVVGLPSAGLRFQRPSSRAKRTQARKLPPLATVPTFRMDQDDEPPTAKARDCSLARSFAALGAEIHRLDGSPATAMQLDLDCDTLPKVSAGVRCQRHKLPALSYAPKPVPAAVVASRRFASSQQWGRDALPFAPATSC